MFQFTSDLLFLEWMVILDLTLFQFNFFLGACHVPLAGNSMLSPLAGRTLRAAPYAIAVVLALVHAVVALQGKGLESDPELAYCCVRRDWYDVDVCSAAICLVL